MTRYLIDLRSVTPDDRARIIDTIETYSFTGASLVGTSFVFSFFLENEEELNQIPGIPLHLVQRFP